MRMNSDIYSDYGASDKALALIDRSGPVQDEVVPCHLVARRSTGQSDSQKL